MDPLDIEKTRKDFSEEKIQRARKKTWEALEAAVPQIQVGMNEEEARAIVNNCITEAGSEKLWHKTHVRIGPNTLKSFRETSDTSVRLGPNDIFFLDIGPVFDGYEGDAGATFVSGPDPIRQKCAADAREIFRLTRQHWFETGANGEVLYAFAQRMAEKLGWLMVPKMAEGHRVSDFPHLLYHRGSLSQIPFRPAPSRWILEIQIRHPQEAFGAFFEDLLI